MRAAAAAAALNCRASRDFRDTLSSCWDREARDPSRSSPSVPRVTRATNGVDVKHRASVSTDTGWRAGTENARSGRLPKGPRTSTAQRCPPRSASARSSDGSVARLRCNQANEAPKRRAPPVAGATRGARSTHPLRRAETELVARGELDRDGVAATSGQARHEAVQRATARELRDRERTREHATGGRLELTRRRLQVDRRLARPYGRCSTPVDAEDLRVSSAGSTASSSPSASGSSADPSCCRPR